MVTVAVCEVLWLLVGDLMHEISNDGARDQFEGLLATVIVPAMIKCARVCLYTYTNLFLSK